MERERERYCYSIYCITAQKVPLKYGNTQNILMVVAAVAGTHYYDKITMRMPILGK